MPDTPQFAGADLARQALQAVRAAARTAPTKQPQRAKPKTRRPSGSGRDLVGLGQVIASLTADAGWSGSVEGGNVIDQWATLCPQYATTVQPIAYDPGRCRLDLRPASHAYATQLRLLGGQLAKQINDKAGRTVVRSIRVLPVGNVTAGELPAPEATNAAPEVPIRTRETASDGYRQALEAHQAAKPDQQPLNEYVAQARARQDASLAGPGWREPEQQFTRAMDELERAAGPDRNRSEAVRRAAIARKHAADRPVRRAFD
jgi:predicted nucleic acid-binding Zn ribbon protein